MMGRQEAQERRHLKAAGWEIAQSDRVRFNGGSETDSHFIAKAQVGFYLRANGYRIDSEVSNADGSAEADIIAYAKDGPPFVVELETELEQNTDETVERKMSQFYYNEPFCEVFILDVDKMPDDRGSQLKWVDAELPGSIEKCLTG